MDKVENDLRYRKTIIVNGIKATGFYSNATEEIDNIWLDGLGHMACAYFSVGRMARGRFYSNQLDVFLIEREINGTKTKSLPYSANNLGDYGWVDTNRGFVSAAAWYIFVKNAFNPMTLKTYPTTSSSKE